MDGLNHDDAELNDLEETNDNDTSSSTSSHIARKRDAQDQMINESSKSLDKAHQTEKIL